MRPRTGGRPSRAVVLGICAVVVLVAAGGTAWAMTRTSGPHYRVARVSRATLTESVVEVGTVATVRQATLAFPVAGTIATVPVRLGQRVRAGQTLATLDTTSLLAQVVSARGSIAEDRQKLATDEAAQTDDATATATAGDASTAADGSPTAGGAAGGAGAAPHPSPSASPSPSATPTGAHHSPGAPHPSTSGSGHGSGSPHGSAADLAAVRRDQRMVTRGQATVDALLRGPVTPTNPRVLSVDQRAVTAACASSTVTFTAVSDAHGVLTGTVSGAAGLPVSLPGATFADGTSVPAGSVAADGTYTFGTSAEPLAASASFTVQLGAGNAGAVAVGPCAAALTTVQHDETAVATAEQQLSDAENTLATALSTWATDLAKSGSNGSGQPSGSGQHSSSGQHSGSGEPTGQSSSASHQSGSPTGQQSQTITPARLAADQRQIDAARAELAVARQDVTEAVLTSPIAGSIAAVSLQSGSAVGAGSSTATITVLGSGQQAVQTTVGIADIDLVKRGQHATVRVDGVARPLRGTVSQIGTMNTSGTSGTTTTYPVTVVLATTATRLYDGAGATATIKVGSAHRVLAVPVSAVSTLGTRDVVRVLQHGSATAVPVSVGLVGTARIQITSGLSAGQLVVLADLRAAIPSSTSTTGRFGGGAGFAVRVAGGGAGAGIGGGAFGGGGFGGGR